MNRDVADVANLVQRQRRFQFDGNWNHPIITQVMLCHVRGINYIRRDIVFFNF